MHTWIAKPDLKTAQHLSPALDICGNTHKVLRWFWKQCTKYEVFHVILWIWWHNAIIFIWAELTSATSFVTTKPVWFNEKLERIQSTVLEVSVTNDGSIQRFHSSPCECSHITRKKCLQRYHVSMSEQLTLKSLN